MNKYRIIVRGADAIGYSFLQNVLYIAKKGGEVVGIPRMNFPYQAEMTLETKEHLKSTATLTVIPERETYTEAALSKLNMADLREVGKQWGVSERDREILTKKILAAIRKAAKQEEQAQKPEESSVAEGDVGVPLPSSESVPEAQ